MITKLFKIVDTDTEINVMASKMTSDIGEEKVILKHAGYGEIKGLVILTIIDPESIESSYSVFYWGYGSTLSQAHLYIEKHFNELKTGTEIDVRKIRSKL